MWYKGAASGGGKTGDTIYRDLWIQAVLAKCFGMFQGGKQYK